jgi:hypothetical protein
MQRCRKPSKAWNLVAEEIVGTIAKLSQPLDQLLDCRHVEVNLGISLILF